MSLTLQKTPEELRVQFSELKRGRDLAVLLDVKYSTLYYYLFTRPLENQYITFQIPKRSGGYRTIFAPNSPLKILQQKLNQVLQAVYVPKPNIFGFISDRSIVDNARSHVGRRYVLNIDLLDFFPSINFGRVRGLFMKPPYSLGEKVATFIAQLCCYKNATPQGAPTSPIVSNMICSRLDSNLKRLARECRCFYTRYADDITFSTESGNFPRSLAYQDSENEGKSAIAGGRLNQIIESNGFAINTAKVKLQTPLLRQTVTGLVVNDRVNVKREFVRQVRAMLHAWGKHGLSAATVEYRQKYNRRYRGPFAPEPPFERIVEGKIEYLGMIKGKEDPVYLKYLNRFRAMPR